MTVENSNTFRRPALRNINVIDAEVKRRFLNTRSQKHKRIVREVSSKRSGSAKRARQDTNASLGIAFSKELLPPV